MPPTSIIIFAIIIVTTAANKTATRDCDNSYTTTCLKLDIVSFVDKLNEEDHYNVLPGLSVIKENLTATSTSDLVAELARDFPDDPDARLDAFLMKKVTGYFNTHSIRLNLFQDDKAIEQGTARHRGRRRGIGAILAAAAMMKGTLFALALSGLAALAGKALMTALISLLLSAIIGLKSLTHGGKSTTYEVIAKPVYTHSNTHSVSHEEHGGHYGHSSYGRSFDVPIPLALQNGYEPAKV